MEQAGREGVAGAGAVERLHGEPGHMSVEALGGEVTAVAPERHRNFGCTELAHASRGARAPPRR